MTSATLWLDGSVLVGNAHLPVRQTAALLDAIDQERSIRAAAERLELSYRSVWGRLGTLEREFGRPLVAKTKGHGSALTPAGLSLRDAIRSAAARIDGVIAEEASLLQSRLREIVGATPAPWRIACSHDPTLMDALAGIPGLDVSVVGSSEALDRLLSERADAAGFHRCPEPGEGSKGAIELDPTTFKTRPLFRREQGLIVAAGNPLGITSVADLVRRDVVFVNRQRGSGTRDWTDHLMAKAGVRPTAVRGYATEEFTHHAVAATVAAGVASAGMGVRGAAERFGLGFMSLAEETYFLATRRDEAHPGLGMLLDTLGLGSTHEAAAEETNARDQSAAEAGRATSARDGVSEASSRRT